MRHIVSISLPKEELTHARSLAKKRGYRSMSSYIRHLVKADQEMISDEQLLKNVRLARKEYRSGKAIKAKSMTDLL